jgi:hypothetical protein
MNRDNREDDVTEEHGDQEEQVEVEVDGIEVEVEVVEVDEEAEGPDEATEEYEVKGEDLLSRVKELVREGNVRRITIRTEQGNTLIEIPLAIGVVGALLLPVWAAVGAIAALVANCTIKVERRED